MSATKHAQGHGLSTLAHELRNPLASIMSSVELMQTLGQHDKEIPHLIEVVDQKVTTMATALDKFLEVSEASQDSAPVQRSPQTGLRVLVVDDNTTAADSLGRLLALRGYDVQIAYGGTEGFEKALSFLPQAAILDIEMPDIDGYELAEMLRKEKFFCTTIALTGYGQEQDKQKASKAGFDFHLTKPSRLNDVETILQKVASVIERDSQSVIPSSISG